MPSKIIFTSKTKVGVDAGKIPSSVDVLVQTDNSPNMDDFRNWASDTNALISLNTTLQNEGIGNTSAGAQYFNRYGSSNLYSTKLIPSTDYAGRTVAAQGDNRSWIRKDYIENYTITAKGSQDRSKSIFVVTGFSQTEKLLTVIVPSQGGTSTNPPTSNITGNPPQLPYTFDGSLLRKRTSSSSNTVGSTSLLLTTTGSNYGTNVATYGIYPGSAVSGTGIPPETFVASSYTAAVWPGASSLTIPIVDSQGSPVALTSNCQNETVYFEIPEGITPPGVPHLVTVNGATTPSNGGPGLAIPNTNPIQYYPSATFAVYYNEDSDILEIYVVNSGNGYSNLNQSTTNKLVIPGSFVGGDDGDNDVTITAYTLNTFSILITSTDFQDKNVNLQDTINSEQTGIDLFGWQGTSAGTLTKSATMSSGNSFITVTDASLITKGMLVTSSTGYGIPADTIVADSYVSGLTIPLAQLNGITPQKVTLTYSSAINVTFKYSATFTNVSGTNIAGTGSGATFIVTKNDNNTYNVFLTNPGISYTPGTTIKILGTQIGGVSPANDLIISVDKSLSKFPAGTRVTFFEKSANNYGYYDLYLSSNALPGVTFSRSSAASGNNIGNTSITVVAGSGTIAAGQTISGLTTSVVGSAVYVGDTYQSGSLVVPLTESDGFTVVSLTASGNNKSLTFASNTEIVDGDRLIFYRSYNSFWSQLNSGSIFEGIPTNYIAWYRGTRISTKQIAATLIPPNNTSSGYSLYSQRFRVDTTTNLKTSIQPNNDWSLYLQYGKNLDPKWETLTIVSAELVSQYTGEDNKIHYVVDLLLQYPSKYSWNLTTQPLDYCYVYKNILGGVYSDYITQTVPYNKVFVYSEWLWKAPTSINIQISGSFEGVSGAIYKLSSVNEAITGSTPTFRVADKDTYSMYFKTWRDLVPQTYTQTLTPNQFKIVSTGSDPRYIYANPRNIVFRSLPNYNAYVSFETGYLYLGFQPETNQNISYTNNVIRLDTYASYAPQSPGIYTYSFGRQVIYYEYFAWNYYTDGLNTTNVYTGNPTTLSVPYKFLSTTPYSQPAEIRSTGSSNAVRVDLPGHGFQAGDRVLFNNNLPSGVNYGYIDQRGNRSGGIYYVSATNLTIDSFEFSATLGGASVKSSSGSTSSPDIRTNAYVLQPIQLVSDITASQTTGIQVTGMHGLVIRGVYKIQAGTTEPIQLQDQFYYIKREFPNRVSVDGNPSTITSIIRTSGSQTVTVITSTAHGLSNGDRVVITTSDSTLNTTDAAAGIAQVVNGTQFRYTTTATTAASLTTGTAQPRAGWNRYLKINNEIISFDYYTIDGNNRYTLYGVQRGQLSTTAAAQTAIATSGGRDFSIAFDTWSPNGVRIQNSIFNTDGTLQANVNLTLQNNWTYTRDFPDMGGSNGLLYYGVGRRDVTIPSRWEVALYGPGYFAPGYMSSVSFPSSAVDPARTPGTYVLYPTTTTGIGSAAQLSIQIGYVTTQSGVAFNSGDTSIALTDNTYLVSGLRIIGNGIQANTFIGSITGFPGSYTITLVDSTGTIPRATNSSQTSATLDFHNATGSITAVPYVASNGNTYYGNNYKIGDTVTVTGASIGGGSNIVFTITNVNVGSLWDGMDYCQPGISKKLNKNPYYQALYKESSEVKYYQEPAEMGQRSYEDIFGAFTQAMVKTKNIVSGIPDDTTPYYNTRSSSDTILLQASRDQYFAYLSGLIKRPKYLTAASTVNSNTIKFNDAVGIEVGDTVYGPGISPDGAVIKSIAGDQYFTLSYRNGVIKIGNGTYKKTSGSWGWNADAYSNTGYSTDVYAQAQAYDRNNWLMFGLNTDPLADSSYASLDYAWYFTNGGGLYIYENGNYIGYYGVYYTSTECRVEYTASYVTYYKDGAAQRTVYRPQGNSLYFDSSYYSIGGSLTNVGYGSISAVNSTNAEATIQLREKRVVTKDIVVRKYQKIDIEGLGQVCELTIDNSYNISQLQTSDIGPFKYYVSEIKFEYVDPVYQSQFKTFFFEEDKYSAPILKTDIQNSTGYLLLYLKNPILLADSTKEKYDSSLYALKSKIEIVTFEDYKINPEIIRYVSLATPTTTGVTTLPVDTSVTYTNTSASSTSGGGTGATFNIIRTNSTSYNVILNNPGTSGYTASSVITINGALLGGTTPINDLTINVTAVSGGAITNYTFSGLAVASLPSGAQFSVTRNSNSTYTVTRTNGGTGYTNGNTIKILGTQVGSESPDNDIIITVTGSTGGVINTSGFTYTGTALAPNKIAVTNTSGISIGRLVESYNPGGLSTYSGTLPSGTTVTYIDSDSVLTVSNNPSTSGLAALRFTSSVTYPVGTQYIIDPSPNLYKNSRYILDTARPSYFTSKWNIGATELDLYFSPDVTDPSSSINYPFNIDDPVKYYAVDSGDRIVYNLSSITYDGSASVFNRTSSDPSFGSLIQNQKVYFTNIPAGVSLSENTAYYIINPQTSYFTIASVVDGAALDVTGGSTVSNTYLKMRRVYDSGIDKNLLRTSLTYFDYQTNSSTVEVPSGEVQVKTVAANGGTINDGLVVSQTSSGTAKISYTAISATNVSSTGTSASFDVSKSAGKYGTPTLNTAGTGYKVSDTLKLLGSSLGGVNTTNDISITVSTVSAVNYTNIPASTTSGTGNNATFNVSRTGTTYTVTLASGGSGYSTTSVLSIPGTSVGGGSDNNITINVTGVTSGVINTSGFTYSGNAAASNPILTFTHNGGSGGAANAQTTYTGLTGTVTGGGSGATYTATISGTSYSITRTADGSGYTSTSVITIPGTSLGGSTPANDLSITTSSVSTGGSKLLVTNGNNIKAGMYVVSNTPGIPTLTVVASNYVSGSTIVPLRDINGNQIALTANMSGATNICFTNGSVRVYEYNGTSYTTYPYIGVSYRPSASGYSTEASALAQIPSSTYTDQIHFTFTNNTLPQELYPYAKIEVRWPSTTLSQSVSASDTIIKVVGTIPDGYPDFGNIKIGTERIYYGYKTPTFFGDCVIKFPHTAGDTIIHSPNYTIKVDGLLQNGCAENSQTKLIVMSATPSTGVGYSGTSAQTLYVAGFEMDQDPTNAISFPSTAKYYAVNDKLNSGTVVTVNRTGNSISLPANAIKTGQTINDGDEIILQSSFGLGSGYKIVSLVSSTRVQLNKATVTDTTTLTTGTSNYRRLFTVDSSIISGMNDTFIDSATNFNSKRGLKYVGLSGCTDFKPVKCSKIKYATVASNKYSNTITLADDLTATTYALTGLSSYYSSGSTKATGVKSVLLYDGEDYEIKSINGRVVTLVQPLKQKVRFRDAVTIKSDAYLPEFERVPNVKGLVYGPQKAVFYDRYRAAEVTVNFNIGYTGGVNRYRWRLEFTRGVPSGLALNDKISTNLNYNDYYISCLPSSTEQGVSTTINQIIVSSTSSIWPTRDGSNRNVNQGIIYLSKPSGYVARDFESASMQIGGYKNSSRQQIVPTQVLAESTGGAIADIEAVSTRASRDIFTTSLGEVLGRFLFKSINFASSNRPNLWRNTITPPTGMNVKTAKLLSYLVNETPNFITFKSTTNSIIFYGNVSTWNSFTATGVVINNIGLDTTNSRILYACSSNTIRWASYSTPATLNSVTISGSGTNTYINYVNGYYFVGNSTGTLYYSTNLSTWSSITTGNTSQIVGVYYDDFKYIITHELISGSGFIYKNYTMESVGATLKGLTNLFAPKKTTSSVFGFGKILESGYTVFDGVSTYSAPAVEVYEYENFTDYTSDDISDDFNTSGLSFNFGQFIAYGQQTSTLRQFAKFSSNARTWSTIDFDGNVSATDEITGFVYGGYNTYAAIVWNSATSTNKILISSVKQQSNSDLTPADLIETGRYRTIETNQSVKLYKFKTITTSQEGNLLIWNGTNLIWLKNLFGSPIKSNEFTDYKPIAAENYVVYAKNTRVLPNLRSANDTSNGASRPITIYNDQLPLGTATVANSGGGVNSNSTIGGYEYNTYTGVSIQHPAVDSTYGTPTPSYATATVVVTDTGIVSGVYVDATSDYYTSTTGLNLISGTGTPAFNYSRTVIKNGVTWVAGDSTSVTTTLSVAVGASSAGPIQVASSTGIAAGMEVYSTTGGTWAQATYYVSIAYNAGSTTVPLVTAAGLPVSLPAVAINHGVTFRKNIIRIPAGANVSGILPGMGVSITGTFSTQIPTGTIVLSNYRARKSGDATYDGPQEIPVSKPPAVFANQAVTFTASGVQATATTTSTALDTKTFTLNGSVTNDVGYMVLYRNSINGIEYIAMFFNSSGSLIDCISDLKATDIAHLARTEAFAQGL
jgi:hypothetical protein